MEINKGMDRQVLVIPPWYTVIVFKFVDTNFSYFREEYTYYESPTIVSTYIYWYKYSLNS